MRINYSACTEKKKEIQNKYQKLIENNQDAELEKFL